MAIFGGRIGIEWNSNHKMMVVIGLFESDSTMLHYDSKSM